MPNENSYEVALQKSNAIREGREDAREVHHAYR